jgi:molybdopterin-guanine dinucleotide biosynthesis protein A
LIELCIELGKHFLTHFAGNYKRKRLSAYLLTLKQGENESIKDFMARFNTEELSVDDHAS